MSTDAQRGQMVTVMQTLIAHRAQIGYRQLRPMQTSRFKTLAQLVAHFKAGQGIAMDCSEAYTLVCRLGGIHDPNGLGYDGQGWTGSMLDYLPHYSQVSHGHPGAGVVFGAYPGTHVAAVMKMDGQNPVLFSHGTAAGPSAITLDDERQGFPGQPITMLDIGHL